MDVVAAFVAPFVPIVFFIPSIIGLIVCFDACKKDRIITDLRTALDATEENAVKTEVELIRVIESQETRLRELTMAIMVLQIKFDRRFENPQEGHLH